MKKNILIVVLSVLLMIMGVINSSVKKEAIFWKQVASDWIKLAGYNNVIVTYVYGGGKGWQEYYVTAQEDNDQTWKEQAEVWKKSALTWKDIAEAREKHLTKEGLAEMGK